MIRLQDLKRISDYEWEIPQSFRSDMRGPVRIFATRRLIEQVVQDRSLEQAVNAATLPGLVGAVTVMPDMHQGYGFPIGGVAATRYPEGVISPGGIGYDINCLPAGTRLLHRHGYTRPIEELRETLEHDALTCFRLEEPAPDAAPAMLWFERPADDDVLLLRTASGREIRATADHPFWTKEGMRPLGELRPGDWVAVHPFEGVPYEAPPGKTLVDEEGLRAFLRRLGKGERGNALGQILAHLRRRGLLPLRADSPAVPYLCKVLGYLFGDGTLRFDAKSGKGVIAFYGEAQDLEEIRADIARLGFQASRVWKRRRAHAIQTPYDHYTFERTETWITVSSTALAALLAYLGAPVGNKAQQDYVLPKWLHEAPRWQKRLFLAAFFGAELSAPRAVSGHARTPDAPAISMNKREAHQESGLAFLEQIAAWLEEFGVQTQPIARRREQVNRDGSVSIRLRLVIRGDAENLIRLWGRVGYLYNRKRQARAAAAVSYLMHKQQHIAARERAAQQAVELVAAGVPPQEMYRTLAGETVNQRFLERSLYEGRRTAPRISAEFPAFEDFLRQATAGLGESGLVWEQVVAVEADDYQGAVYDLTMDHPDHNFIAEGFLVSNCGVRLLASHIEYEAAQPYLEEAAEALNRYCPSGVGKGGLVKLSAAQLDEVLEHGARWALKNGYATEADLARTEEGGSVEGADPNKVSPRAKQRGRPQLGSLGAGNHFIEIDLVEEIYDEEAARVMGLRQGCLAVQIHCGSRGLGHQVCSDYVKTFQRAVQRYGIHLPDRELVCAPLNSPEGQDYLAAMRAAANFAFANRQLLAHAARRAFEEVFAGKVKNWHLHQVYDIAHNMGKIETHEYEGERVKVCVHRKGATRAFGPGAPGLPSEYRAIGQPVIIPGSMGTGSWVLVGTEESMSRTWGSTCHGAGRVMSRSKAKKTIRGEKLRRELEQEGIHILAGSMPGLAEEAPQAYKDVDEVVETVSKAHIARKVARLRPLAVIKG
ncbi:MAG: RNA-splicing ligase RtcB [Anaerolineae bacterium]|nr:MAG: RNA-splicing ligase RtcB [Anaerolineae bacterium]